MFGVERNTLYRLIKSGRIPAVNIGTRLIRIKRSDMENRFLTRPESIAEKEKPIPKLYSMEPEDCYTITQVCEKYHIKILHSIPTNRELCICTQTRNR